MRTFHNHQKAIKDIFDIYIECDKKDGYKYYIDEPEQLQKDHLRNWIISTYTTLNCIKANCKIRDRIIFERIPSGETWLTPIMNAMCQNRVIQIKHQAFEKDEPCCFEIEPYYLKIVKRRWYVIARNPLYSEQNKANGIMPNDVYLTYALDRILNIKETDKFYTIKEDFDINSYFDGCCGITTSDKPIERIIIRAYNNSANYLRTLPLHESQKELCNEQNSTLFEYHLKPTFEFYQMIFYFGINVEIISPKSIRIEMLKYIKTLMKYYKNEEND